MAKGKTDIELVNELRLRLDELKTNRKQYDAIQQDVYDYVLSRRTDYFNETPQAEGERRGGKIYDGTPISAVKLYADGLQGHMVSQAISWFKLRLPDELEKLPGVRLWLEETERRMYKQFAESNFYDEIPELFQDAVAGGTGTIYIEEDLDINGINYSTRTPKEIYIAEDRYGKVDTVYRRFLMTRRQIAQEFEDDITDDFKERLEATPYEKIAVIQAVYPRKEPSKYKIANTSKPYASVYFLESEESGNLLRESGYDEFPYLVWRFRKNSDETYGRSDVIDVLPEIKKLNTMGKTLLKAAQLQVEPPMNVPADQKGQVRLVPKGFNYYKKPDHQISAIQTTGAYPIGLDRENRSREIIEEALQVQFFLMLSRVDKQMTATEIMERQGEKAIALSPIIGSLNQEFLKPVIELTYSIMERQGKIPAPPQALAQAQGAEIDIEFHGPLAQAQRKYLTTQGAQQALAAVLPLAQVKPDIVDLIDFDALARQMMKEMGMPASALRDEKTVKQIRQIKQQMQAQMMQQQQMQEQAKLAPALSKAPESGSPMAEAMAQPQKAGGMMQ